MEGNFNIGQHLERMVAERGDGVAVKVPLRRKGEFLELSFEELAVEVSRWRGLMEDRGVRQGDRVLVMVRQGLPLIGAVFALFQMRAVPVVIDPGMGRKSFLECVRRTRPQVLVGVPMAMLLSRIFRKSFKSVSVRVPASGKAWARQGHERAGSREAVFCSAETRAAILFTSGSTGAPKGVVYTHGMFGAQVELLRKFYGFEGGEVDMPLLAVFALFNPGFGMTTVVPRMNPSRPAQADVKELVGAMKREGVTNAFGSPVLWGKIADYCLEKGEELPLVRRALCAGAPVPPALWEKLRKILPNGEAHSPYGATEALPVSSVCSREVIGGTDAATLAGKGTCVGRVLPGVEVRIVEIVEGAIEEMSGARVLGAGELGEIVVCGEQVTREYDGLLEATRLAKIRDGERVWHRMGDCGYLDAEGRLWFCGRKSERVVINGETLFTEQVEPIFNAHRGVKRSALLGLDRKDGRRRRAAVVVEVPAEDFKLMERDEDVRAEFLAQLRLMAMAHEHTAGINLFYLRRDFPVDVRHNAKINREALGRWAATARGYKANPLR